LPRSASRGSAGNGGRRRAKPGADVWHPGEGSTASKKGEEVMHSKATVKRILHAKLDDLAKQIHDEHLAVGTSLRQCLEHAKNAGELLLRAKNTFVHGSWEKWLEDNVEVSVRRAQSYMQIAKHWDEIEAKAPAPALLSMSIEGALKLI